MPSVLWRCPPGPENVPRILLPDVLGRLRDVVDIGPSPVAGAGDFTGPGVREVLAETEILATGRGVPGRSARPFGRHRQACLPAPV